MANLITIRIGSSVTTGKGRFSILVLVIYTEALMRLLCNPEEKNIGALQGGSEKTRSGLTLPSLSGCHCQTLVWELVYPQAGTYSFRFARSLSPSASFPFRLWVTVDFALAGKLRARRSL